MLDSYHFYFGSLYFLQNLLSSLDLLFLLAKGGASFLFPSHSDALQTLLRAQEESSRIPPGPKVLSWAPGPLLWHHCHPLHPMKRAMALALAIPLSWDPFFPFLCFNLKHNLWQPAPCTLLYPPLPLALPPTPTLLYKKLFILLVSASSLPIHTSTADH